MKIKFFKLFNYLFIYCYPIYYPLYGAWKAFADRRERTILRMLVRPEMTVIDVGANIGIYTSFFAKLVGSRGKIYAFEPGLTNFSHLKTNLKELKNVAINRSAVGNDSGFIKLYLSDELNVDHQTYDDGSGRATELVPIISLDDYFNVGQKVNLIKIDVQGYEYNVLQGAQRVLRENPDIKIFMEYWPYGLEQAGIKPAALEKLIESLNFKIEATEGHETNKKFNIHLHNSNDINDYCNVILSRKNK